jgi:gliding motility-associated-like protein
MLSYACFAQKEASNWYFGRRAGIKFNDDGSVAVLTGSLMYTNEGCSTISDAAGNLLFYTDGRNIWDRNHVVMPNANYNAGTGLLGDPSSTLSGIIVPNETNPDIYYVFTVDEPHHVNAAVYPAQYVGSYVEGNITQGQPTADDGYNNGLNYSVVDLSVTGTNGSMGDVTLANAHLLTYDPANIEEAKYKCSEKITAVKNYDGTGYWVLSHFIDRFYAYYVDENGVNPTPVITQIAPVVPTSGYRRNALGCFKASPDGRHLAIAHQQLGTVTGEGATNGCVYLYDFDNQTGQVSNPRLVANNINPYGIEFSAEAKKLYVCLDLGQNAYIRQYNLEAAAINNTGVTIGQVPGGAALQMGPNGKIYAADWGLASLSVINNPEETGALCNFVPHAVTLNTDMQCVFGLPTFITSFFSAAIVFDATCLGDTTTFSLTSNYAFDSVSWDFGDGSPPSALAEPQHTFAATGTYTVTAHITYNGETNTTSREVTIHQAASATAPPTVTVCDPDNNGVYSFNLSQYNDTILGGLSPDVFSVTYFTSQADADANVTTPLDAALFNNTTNPQTIWARVQNVANAACYALTSFQLQVGNTPVLGSDIFELCDDSQDGSDANGFTTFNFADFTPQWVQNSGFTITYHATEADALAAQGPLPQQYYNTTQGSQVVYSRIENNTYAECTTVLPVTLVVNPLPGNVQNAVLIQCDTGASPDGFTSFNLAQANLQYTNGNAGFSVEYFIDSNDAQAGTGSVTGLYTNTSNPQTISARVTNMATGCYRVLPLELHVSTGVFAPVEIERCDDDGTEDGMASFDLALSGFESPLLSVVYYTSLQDALAEQNAIAVPTAYTNSISIQQSVYARIEEGNACMAIREIILHVRPLPDIDVNETAIVCLNTMDYIELDAGVSTNQQNYTYLWSTGQTTHSIYTNQPGIYTVTVTDITHATLCSKLRTITVVPSNIALIDNITVTDLTENNTITVVALPVGGVNTSYLYSLNAPNGPWQEYPYFENVTPGIHTLYVYDVNGCGVVSSRVSVLAIPNFFSPNGDGVNDYWHITGINGSGYNNSKIFIFDRFGKLLADVKPTGPGWNGVYNGYNLPATDYWYLVELEDGRTVRGHFSLVR